ncbi:domain found in IF2B/IF5-domain-containing protein [Rhodotorula diobovata]|uniref:Domain found in IF2B/IF5-domain-containing protein n=1 Tax=Rhodotorula diobovata TaxID=5288 RepID=A0A5C5FZD1_9BASI|nr:domain found in IF2B/IF5-domain-containing protein [Rhodotorula diobovata]
MDEFADLKKKRKKSSKKAFDLEAFEKELAESESAEASASGEPKSILKKKVAAGSDEENEGEGEGDDEPVEGEDPFAKEDQDEEEGHLSKAEAAAQAKAWLKEDRDYTYTELLGRFFSLLYQSHPSLSGGTNKKKYTIPPPQLFREGNKRSIFANIADICKRMHRQPEHVIAFLFAELGTNGSVDGSARLVIKGRFQQKQIENVLRRYIVEYVTCKTCKSPDTTMTKDNRLFFMTCSSCGSTRSVQAIKTGFTATTRGASPPLSLAFAPVLVGLEARARRLTSFFCLSLSPLSPLPDPHLRLDDPSPSSFHPTLRQLLVVPHAPERRRHNRGIGVGRTRRRVHGSTSVSR